MLGIHYALAYCSGIINTVYYFITVVHALGPGDKTTTTTTRSMRNPSLFFCGTFFHGLRPRHHDRGHASARQGSGAERVQMSSTDQVQAFLSGGFGGICLTLVGSPFDLVKVRQQAHTTKSTGAGILASVLRNEGALGLWRGIGPPLLTAMPTWAVVAWSFEFNRQSLRGAGICLDPPAEAALAGAAVAPFTSLIYAPVERVKVLLQVDGERMALGQPPRYRGMRHCATEVMRTGGAVSLYKGLCMTLLRDVPAWSVYFYVYHTAKQAFAPVGRGGILDGDAPLAPAATFAAGALAGASTWAVCIPQDTVKTRWQTGRYESHAAVLHSLLRGPGGGVANLFRGFWAIVLGGVPRDGACLAGMEAANRAFSLGRQAWRDHQP
jgi:solute carrier family 25 carnitine/acylcarnitine transporter 20/29